MPTIYNKVTVDGTTLIDLSQDTVSSASDIVSGKTGHLNDGTQVTGTGGSNLSSHEISLEFVDDTSTTLDADFDDAFVGTLITDHTPSAYSGKDVAIAKLDGTAWYTRALYPLKNGTHTFSNGTTVTVTNHEHVRVVVASGNTSDGYIDISDVSENTSNFNTANNVKNHSAKFTIPSGGVAVFTVSNLTSTHGNSNSLNAYGTGSSNLGMAISNIQTGSKTATKTFTSASGLGCLFFVTRYPGTIEFDVTFTVDNVRYV